MYHLPLLWSFFPSPLTHFLPLDHLVSIFITLVNLMPVVETSLSSHVSFLLQFIVLQPIFISTKVDLRVKNIAKNKEVHFIKIKRNPLGGHNNYKCLYTNIRALKYMKYKLIELQREIDNLYLRSNFTASFSIDSISREKIITMQKT